MYHEKSYVKSFRKTNSTYLGLLWSLIEVVILVEPMANSDSIPFYIVFLGWVSWKKNLPHSLMVRWHYRDHHCCQINWDHLLNCKLPRSWPNSVIRKIIICFDEKIIGFFWFYQWSSWRQDGYLDMWISKIKIYL